MEGSQVRPSRPPTSHWRPAPCSCRLPQPHLPRLCRMKSLEQDALRAQMVLSKSQEGRSKRGPLERLAEAPSPAPTPSPTPLEGPCVAEGRQGVGGSACSGDFSQCPLLVPPDIGPQTSTSPGRLVRTSCGLSPRPSLRGGAGSRLHPPLFSSALASLPSRCPLKALSGRRFDYRVFAALPSSRPVYDMQVPGPPGLCGPGRPARLRLSPCLSPLPPRLSPLQPLPCLSGASAVPRAWGLPTQAHVGGLSSLGRGPDLALLPVTVPGLC